MFGASAKGQQQTPAPQHKCIVLITASARSGARPEHDNERQRASPSSNLYVPAGTELINMLDSASLRRGIFYYKQGAPL